MSLAITVNRKLSEGKTIILSGTITPAGSYPSGGDSLDFGPVVGWTSKQPINVDINGKSGFIYQYDYVNKKMLIFGQEPTSATAGVIALSQLAAAGYPAGVTGDVITFFVTFAKG